MKGREWLEAGVGVQSFIMKHGGEGGMCARKSRLEYASKPMCALGCSDFDFFSHFEV